MKFKYNDGGRSQYFKAEDVSDCVTRAIAICLEKDYKEVYNEISNFVGYTPRNGIKHKDTKKVMEHFGFDWKATMAIGSGCKVHLKKSELPNGRIICNVTGHVVAVIDGVINDTHDCSRGGTRCVYGYWYINNHDEKKEKETMKSEYLHIRITPELKEELKRLAEKDMRTPSDYVLKLIKEASKKDKESK